MTAHRPGRIGLLGAFLLLCACGRSEPGLTETADALRECPQGDAAWRSLLDHPDAADDTGGLRESLAGLGEACPKRWEPAWAMAESLMREDLTSEATPHLEASLRLANEASDPTGIALSKNGLGWSAYVEGRYADAETLYRDALQSADDAERIDLASFVHNNLSGVFNDRGLFAAARDHLELAEAGFTEIGHEDSAIGLAHNRAVVLVELGNAVAARQLLEHNHAHAAEAGDPWLSDAAAIVLGNLHLALDEPSTAEDWFGRVGEDSEELALRSRVGRGFARLQMGDVESAVVALDPLVGPSREADRHLGIIVEMFLADALMRQGDRSRAQQILERLHEESGEVGAGDTGWAVRWTLARVHRLEGREDAALQLLREAVALLEAQSSPLDPFGQGLYFLRGRSEPFVDLAAALASRDDPSLYEEIWNITGRARARALRQSLAEADDVLDGGVSLSTFRASLRPGETLLNYLIGDDRGLVMAVTEQETRVARIPGRRSFLESLERYLAAIGHAPAEPGPEAEAAIKNALEDGRRLREDLMGPVEQIIAGSTTVYVVPDRELALLPFAALPSTTSAADAVRYLAHDVDVAVLPLLAAPPRWSGSWEKVFLAGGPTFEADTGFAELPWSGFELSSLRRLWGDHASRLVNGEAFTREGLRPLATEPFGIVHLATHAVASTRDPRECGVILSGGERLGLDDILDLELDGSLVVLSACRTGQGELVPGEGVIGLGWAFLRAGARGIVISHWSAEDMSSARLMVEFHRRLNEGIDPVRALGAARREMAKESPHPARWALYDIVLRPGSMTR